MQSSLDNVYTASEAARMLSVTPQTIRNRLRAGVLDGEKRGDRWVVRRASVDPLVPAAPIDPSRELERRIGSLEAEVERLSRGESSTQELLAALRRERDRYRADAATIRAAAVGVNAAARETDGAMRQLLAVVAAQSEALTQLLGPATADDIVR